MNESIKIALVENHGLFRHALTKMITDAGQNLEILFAISDGKELIKRLNETAVVDHPHLVILNLKNPFMDGFESASWLRNNFPDIKIIALSWNQDEISKVHLAALGVHGYLVKTSDAPVFFATIWAVINGEFYYAESTPGDFNTLKNMAELSPEIKNEIDIFKIWHSLSKEEREFVRLCCTDLKHWEIGGKMKVFASKLDAFREKIYRQFKIDNRIALVLLVTKYKLVEI